MLSKYNENNMRKKKLNGHLRKESDGRFFYAFRMDKIVQTKFHNGQKWSDVKTNKW